MEVSTEPLLAHTSGLGPNQMGLHRVIGHQRGIRRGRHSHQLRWLQQGLHEIGPVSVVVVDTSVARNIHSTGWLG